MALFIPGGTLTDKVVLKNLYAVKGEGSWETVVMREEGKEVHSWPPLTGDPRPSAFSLLYLGMGLISPACEFLPQCRVPAWGEDIEDYSGSSEGGVSVFSRWHQQPQEPQYPPPAQPLLLKPLITNSQPESCATRLLEPVYHYPTIVSGHHQQPPHPPPSPIPSKWDLCHLVCYYILQFFLVCGTMTGFSLVIVGASVHATSPDLLVLMYIGVLLLSVSLFLLVIQCRAQQQRANRNDQHPPTSEQPQPPPSAPMRTLPAAEPPSYALPFNDRRCVEHIL
ncbi:unnamed protein product [Darwinula stevensoni]|uniref:Uncharacterized protein n=1 Tax=Darwinula stevensoni TaxID=69355 RepID=A0A7R8X379_9CRUS|nr:unnamed protein product [Darwinula stevensoni]CAG0884217.1 unnamed protein product [Darwinula stevensoni]